MKKIVFFGTPEPSKEILSFLYSQKNIEVVAVVTNPDRAVGRKKIMTASPVKQFALEKNISVFTPESFTGENSDILHDISADFFIVVAYGKLIPQSLIDIPQSGTFNLHFSLLPQYRGASPVQSSLLAGDTISGISIFELVKKMDAGDIFIQKKCELYQNENQKNYVQVWNEMIEMGKIELQNLIEHFEEYSGKPQKEEEATFCGKFTKSDGEVFPKTETALDIVKKYNAFFLWPGIFLFDKNNKRIKLIEIQLSDKVFEKQKEPGIFFVHDKKLFLSTQKGVLEIFSLQKEGKKPMKGESLSNFSVSL